MGRDAELEELAQAAAIPSMITLLGPPGVGKTHLARALFERCNAGGRTSLFCEVYGVSSASELRWAVARRIGLDRAEASATSDPVVLALEAHRIGLVVLDAADHFSAEMCRLVDRWFDALPHVTILVTSRRRLDLRPSATLPLRPLVVRSEDGRPAPAIELFLARARKYGAAHDELHDHAEMERLVRRLDGLPRAIELFASLSRSWSIRELCDQLERGTRGVASDDLRRSFEVSWSFLPEGAKAALQVAKLFRGGFTWTALAEILACGDSDAVRSLDELLDGSWLVMAEEAPAGERRKGGRRFDLLATTRDFLDSVEAAAAPSSHQARFARYFAQAAWCWCEPPRFATLEGRRWLREERANLEAALEIASRIGDRDARVALETALARVVHDEAPSAEQAARLKSALEEADLEDRKRVIAAIALGRTLHYLGRWTEAIEVALAAMRQGRDEPLLAAHLMQIDVYAHRSHEDYEGAVEAARRLRPMAAAADPNVCAIAQQTEGMLAYWMFDYDRARHALAAAQRAFEVAGIPLAVTEALVYRGLAAFEVGALVEAEAHLVEVEQRLSMQQFRIGSLASMYLGLLRWERGDEEGALQSLQRARNLAGRTGTPWWIALAECHLGAFHHLAGALHDARQSLERALQVGSGMLPKPHTCLAAARLGAVYAELGDLVAAESAFADAERDLTSQCHSSVARAVHLYRGSVDLLLAKRCGGDEAKARAHVHAAELRLARQGEGEPMFSDERLSRRYLEQALARHAAERAPVTSSPSPSAGKAAERSLELVTRHGRSRVVCPPDPAGFNLFLDVTSARATVEDRGEVDFRNRPVLMQLLAVVLADPNARFEKARLFTDVWRTEFRTASQSGALYKAIERLARLLSPEDLRRFFRWDEEGRLVLLAERPGLVTPMRS
ncbi:AAA family ATPase [Polyangium sp. 6x1]|uniref:ATP-binding protein n=1 Tax=Polyangium sp. 6x1 TaxID=3042689 RepID=UPI0024825C01|nr:AAA family ATPase [Polyangium sp. 6x1]MDI1446265.1 AAA family ATPase [Polyangium sp. 6x1]